MARKRNLYFGFGPAPKKERLTVYRRPKGRVPRASRASRASHPSQGVRDPVRSDVASALVNLGYSAKAAAAKAAKAAGSDFTSLFRSAMQQNPRVLPEMTDEQIAGIHKLIKGNAMAQKKRKSKKKRSSRKGKMPAGLRKYWAKKRAAKARRKNSRRRRTTKPRRRKASLRVRNYRKTRHVSKPRRKKRNPPQKLPQHIDLGSGFTSGQIKKIARAIGRATGKRTRIVKR